MFHHPASNALALFVLGLVAVLLVAGVVASVSLARAGWRRWLCDTWERIDREKFWLSHVHAFGEDSRACFQRAYGRTLRADVAWAICQAKRLRAVAWSAVVWRAYRHLIQRPQQRRIDAYNRSIAQHEANVREWKEYVQANDLEHGWGG